ncbi:MAG: DUF86 domain-containing protein [Deltaproteobacteria bacterium]|nr:DUF86 domain-containing protein [Deltaproteobacteria bacterium]
MTMLDRELITRHLTELDEVLAYLRSKQGLQERDILATYELRLAIERAFHLAIQNVVDIGNHVLASLSVTAVETYADIPRALAEQRVISKPLADRLMRMARFRNILVHEYVKVETKKLVEFLGHLEDFSSFAQSINKWLQHE